MNNIQNC